MDALNGVDIKCSYASMDEILDTLGLKWRGTPGDGTSEDLEKPADASGTVTFHLPAKVVGANIRREVSVAYAVKRYNLWTPSEELLLNILGFQNPDKDLPKPEVPLAKDGVLDLMEFKIDASVLVNPWPFIAAGQRVWLSVEGRTAAGAYTIDLLKGHPLNDTQASKGLDETLLRTELLKLVHRSDVTVKCKVIFDRSTEEASAIDFPSLPLNIRTRYDYLKPVITLVKNAQNIGIPEGELTYDKRLTIEGTATRGEKVDVQINGVSKGTPPVNESGIWTVQVTLDEGSQRVIAIAQYDADEKNSEPRTFTIGVATQPAITALSDSKGAVAQNGTTYDEEVTVTVEADPNQIVQLYDGGTAIGALIPLDGKGEGTTKLANLSQKTYSIKARALYGEQLESPAHVFTAKLHVTATLDSVRHSGGELLNGGHTASASVALEGRVTPFYSVQIYHNNSAKHIVQGNGSGFWSTTLPTILGSNSVSAKAVATGQDSETRNFTKIVPITSEKFDQYSTRHVSPGLNIPLTSMTIYHLVGGTGFIGICPLSETFTGPYPPLPGRSSGQTLEMHWKGLGTSQHMRIRFNWGYSSVSFYLRFSQTHNLWIRFLDKNDRPIHQYTLPLNFDAQLVSYSHQSIDIWGIEVQTSEMDLVSLDCFTMTYR